MFGRSIENQDKNAKAVHHEGGVTYFTKRTEQAVLFVMTLGMLIWGAVELITNLVSG